MKIRLATAEDAAPLWALAEAYLASQVELGSPDQRKLLAIGIKHGVENGEAIFVAEADGELVGFVAWTGLPNAADGEAVGFGTYVARSHRERGVSAAMRAAAKDHCRKLGYEFVSGAVLLDNDAGVQSAAASGAEVTGYMLRWEL